MSSATAERTFKMMRRIKTWLQSQMGPGVLTNYMFPVIHNQRMDDVDILKVAKEFVSKSLKRKTYF